MTFKEQVAWSRRHFDMIALGGVWAVPRSGMILTKFPEEFRLTALMPYTPEMGAGWEHGFDVPPDADTLLDFQREDFRCLSQRFEACGVRVTDPNNLLKQI